jgi:hypothetical protein
MADFRGMKLGRKPASFDRAPLLGSLPSYSLMPVAVAPVDYSKKVPTYPMLMNDKLGDCAEAGLLHMLQTFKAEGGQIAIPDDQSVVELYHLGAGYDGTPATDQGSSLNGLLSFGQKSPTGIPYAQGQDPEFIKAYAYVDHLDYQHVTNCISNFVGLLTGVQLRQSQMTQDIWDADSSVVIGGHCIYTCGFNLKGPIIVSWGKVIQTTWAWWTQSVEEAWVVLNTDFTGSGDNFTKLVNEAYALTA